MHSHVASGDMVSQAHIKQNLQLLVGVSWWLAWLPELNQTQTCLGRAILVREIKHEHLCSLGLAVAGLGLACGPGCLQATLQTRPL